MMRNMHKIGLTLDAAYDELIMNDLIVKKMFIL